ncbi:MAG: peptidylprolyl isomerase [Prevotellaceae bacterium]|jgi:peptidyl-prolyl cis-trans isomerase SurA|nr:peptidylprolyl isomerase [Prevotellaceae bacterium]
MYKKYVIICVSISLMVSNNLFAQKNIIDEVIWTIGDDAILRSDVEDYKDEARRMGQSIEKNADCAIPEQIAIQKLYLHQAQLDSITIEDKSVNQETEGRMNYYVQQIGSRERLEAYYGKSYDAIREEVWQMTHDQYIIRQVQQKLTEHIKPTPSEVRRYFNSLSKDSVPTIPTEVELQIVSVQPPIPIEEINRTKERLREFAERVNSGETEFSMLARLYSEDVESAKRGGETGFFGRGMMTPEFSNVAFNLTDTKKVSRIAETEYGFHILQLIEKRGDRLNVRHILLKPHVTTADREKAIQLLDSVANQIRAEKLTFEQAVMRFSTDKNTALNAGLMMNGNTGSSKFEYQQLPPEVAKVVYAMKTGEISDPFTMIDQSTNKEVAVVVKLKSRTETHKANILDDYQLLKNIFENKQQQDFLAQWIKQKQKETYISIDPAWANCEFQYSGWIKK